MLRTKDRTKDIVVDETEVKSVNEAAAVGTERIMDYCHRQGVDPPRGPEETYTDLQLFILNKARRFRVPIVDRRNRVRSELLLDFDYRNGRGGAHRE